MAAPGFLITPYNGCSSVPVSKWTFGKLEDVNWEDGTCVQFEYKEGCGGNENRFDSKEECEKICELTKKHLAGNCFKVWSFLYFQ